MQPLQSDWSLGSVNAPYPRVYKHYEKIHKHGPILFHRTQLYKLLLQLIEENDVQWTEEPEHVVCDFYFKINPEGYIRGLILSEEQRAYLALGSK